jgi:putative ABC transport system permease protein
VAALFFAESALLAVFSGLAGFFAGSWLAHRIGYSIFASQITIEPILFPIIMAIAVAVTFSGSAAAIRRAVNFDPVFALRGDA